MSKMISLFVACILQCGILTIAAVFDYGALFTGSGSPASAGPWARTTTTQDGVDVLLKFEALNLTNPYEFIGAVSYSYNNNVDASHVAIIPQLLLYVGTFVLVVDTDENNIHAGGGLNDFDFRLNFAEPPPRFGQFDVAVVRLKALSGVLDAETVLDSLSVVFIQGLGPNADRSLHAITIPVPEAETYVVCFALVGLIGYGFYRRRR